TVKGMAPKATIISQYFSDIIVNTPTYINDYNMALTNNSYHVEQTGCPGDGEYDVVSNFVDDQLNAYPFVLHVFAAGNDRGFPCSPYPSHFGSIKLGFQSAKNTLSVGDINTASYAIDPNCSRGPVNDGRLKPEIVAGGVGILSTYPYNNYGLLTGTSMASPTATGVLALLYERYRQLHGGSNPTGSFIKTPLCTIP